MIVEDEENAGLLDVGFTLRQGRPQAWESDAPPACRRCSSLPILYVVYTHRRRARATSGKGYQRQEMNTLEFDEIGKFERKNAWSAQSHGL